MRKCPALWPEEFVLSKASLSPALEPEESVPSNRKLEFTMESVDADSKTRLSPASLLEESVPSISIEPSITETNPVAAFVLVPDSVVVNVKASPSQKRVPASSIITRLTLPVFIEATSAVAAPLPIAV